MRWRGLFCALIFTAGSSLAVAASAQGQNEANIGAQTDRGRNAESPLAVTVSTDKPLSISSAGNRPTIFGAFIGALPAIIAVIGSLIVVYLGNRQSGKNSSALLNLTAANTKAGVNQRANELEIERIDHSLATFFGPFMQLSEENKLIAELLRSRQPDPSFRTLRALLDPDWRKSASDTDLNLINRIVATGTALRTLIREQAGPTSPAVSDYLARAAAHFTILELADAGALAERTEDFDQHVYPRQLDPVLKLERERLEARRDALLSDLSSQHAAAPALVIPPELALDRAGQAR